MLDIKTLLRTGSEIANYRVYCEMKDRVYSRSSPIGREIIWIYMILGFLITSVYFKGI